MRVEDGGPVRQSTSARLLWDAEHLYVAFRARDRDLRASHQRRDDPLWQEDVVEVFLDPHGTGRIYFELEVSPRGVVFDAVVVQRARGGDGPRDLSALRDWTCDGLRTAVRVDGSIGGGEVSRGWDVEMAVPLLELAPPVMPAPGAGVEWRFNLYRVDRSADGHELQAWAPTGRPDFHRPDRFAILRFV